MHYVIFIFALLLSFVSGYYGIKMLRLHLRIKSWPRAWARIIDKKVEPKKLSNSSRANWTIRAEYSFMANGIAQKGNKIFLIELLRGEKGYLRKSAEDFAAKLPNEVEIYYNPENPEESVIYADGLWMAVILILFCPFILLIGLTQFFS